MKILFDQGTPAPLRHALSDHEVITAYECGWQTLQNGELLRMAEANGFAALITTDQNLRHQQNLGDRYPAIVVLMTTDWRLIRQHLDHLVRVLSTLSPGGYFEVAFPP